MNLLNYPIFNKIPLSIQNLSQQKNLSRALINSLFAIPLILITDFLTLQLPFIGAPPPYIGLGNEGNFICNGVSINYCNLVGYPVSFTNILGSVPWMVYSILRSFKVPWIESSIFTQNIFLAIGIIGFYGVCKIIIPKASPIAIWIPIYLFFTSPFIIGSANIPPLMDGFVLFPFVVFMYVRKWNSKRVAFAAIFSSSGLVIMCDPNAWVPVVSGLALLNLIVFLSGKVGNGHRYTLNLINVGPLILPGAIFTIIAGRSASSRNPIDFIRGMGADWGTVFWPTTHESNSIFSHFFSFVNFADIDRFSGDHSQIYGSYIGPFILLIAIFGISILIKLKEFRHFLVPTFTLLLFYFFTSSGPSLKFFSYSSDGKPAVLSYGDYFLDSKNTILSFPWGWIWNFQPFQSFRGTYRWWIGGLFILCLLCFIAIEQGSKWGPFKKFSLLQHVAGIAILIMSLTVIIPFDLGHTLSRNKINRNMIIQARYDLDNTFIDLGRYSEKVIFLPTSGADYLVYYIAAVSNLKTNNFDFDKLGTVVIKSRPKLVTDVYNSFENGTLNRNLLCNFFTNTEFDGVVLTSIDLRWDSYWWPPNPKIQKGKQDYIDRLSGELEEQGFSIVKRPLANLIQLENVKTCAN